MQITKNYEVLICNLSKYIITISSSSKELETIIKKYSLFFKVLLFGKLFCFRDKNRFYIKRHYLFKSETRKIRFFSSVSKGRWY